LLSSVTQPTCSDANGSFTITNYDVANTYVVTPSIGVTIVGDTVTAPEGTYTVTATLGTCTSADSASAVIDAQPATPVVPLLSSVTQPTCSEANGSFTITNYDVANTYVVTPSTGVTIVGDTVTAPEGTYTVTSGNGTCTSVSSIAIVVNSQPVVPSATVLAITQPDCTDLTGTIEVTSPLGIDLEYSIDGIAYQSNPLFVGVASGSYAVFVRNSSDTTCTSTGTNAFINLWANADCDGDGNPNGTDPHPLVATALDNEFEAAVRDTTTFDIIDNDDFLVGNISISTIGGTAQGSISYNTSTGEISYTPLDSEVGTTVTIEYLVCNTLTGVCDNAIITITVLNYSFEPLVHNAFSPNSGDVINDRFVIEGIEFYQNNTVEIYNRWGVLVYEVTGYDNKDKSFKGVSEGRVTISRGSDLPDGTYYYILRYVDLNGVPREKASYLYVNRER
jgi:gliding motility-associated-like protein